MSELYDVIIIGSGPAGLTAGVYAARANLKTLLFAGVKWGGQLMLTTDVENFPGFENGILGPELMAKMRKQAEKFGVRVIDEEAASVNFASRPFKVGNEEGRSVIIASGAEAVWLGVPGEQRLIGRGVSSCAPCDAPFFKNKKVIVVGGGDAAMEEVLVLTKFAAEVTLVHRSDAFRASKIMQDRVRANSKVKLKLSTEIAEIVGEAKVERVRFKNGETMDVDGVFVAIGHSPTTKLFVGQVDLDEKGYVKSARHGQFARLEDDGAVMMHKYHTMTSKEGVFVAGDVHDYHYRQAVTAAGYGCEAALEVERWLSSHGDSH